MLNEHRVNTLNRGDVFRDWLVDLLGKDSKQVTAGPNPTLVTSSGSTAEISQSLNGLLGPAFFIA